MGDPKMTCSLPWSPEELAQIRRERANFDEENLTALRATRPHFILCEECSGKGLIEDDGQYRECPVCDGTPMITFELVKQYAEQIDSLRKQLRERSNERKAFMTALRIMLTSKSWGAAYGVVCEDYPEMAELVKDYTASARVCCGPQKEAVRELVEAAKKSQQLAYRLLWIAFVWNDHNFKPAHEEARDTCVNCGILTFDEADEFLDEIDAALARVIEGEKL